MKKKKKKIIANSRYFSDNELSAVVRNCYVAIANCDSPGQKCFNLIGIELKSIKQAVTAGRSYHGALRPTVHEATGRFFVEAVVGSRGLGHLLHDHLRLHVLLCSGIYCDMGPLKTHKHRKQVDPNIFRINGSMQNVSLQTI